MCRTDEGFIRLDRRRRRRREGELDTACLADAAADAAGSAALHARTHARTHTSLLLQPPIASCLCICYASALLSKFDS
jgi:hypothetical protein